MQRSHAILIREGILPSRFLLTLKRKVQFVAYFARVADEDD